jgi:hypothetical protein
VGDLVAGTQLIGIEAAEGVERDPQISSGHVVFKEVDCTAPFTRDCRCLSRDFKSKAGLVVLWSGDEAVIDAADSDQPKNFTIGRGLDRFKGLSRGFKDIPERRECLSGECSAYCGGWASRFR